jgi:hypothetical protein
MLKIGVTIRATGFSKLKPEVLNTAFTKKTMPKLYRYIEKATKEAVRDKSALPHYWGRTAFYDDDRQLTGKSGPHMISQYQTRTEDNTLFISNKKTVAGGWNVFWMLNEGTRAHVSFPKFMRFYDRYGSFGGTGPGFRTVQFRRGNTRFVPIFNTYLEQRAQKGVDKGVQLWEMSGAMESEFGKLLRKAGFNVEL